MHINLTVSNNAKFSARDAVKNPDYNLSTNLYDSKIKNIKGLNIAIDYIFKNHLFDIIVEFTTFNKPVGTYNKNILIYELRTHY